MKTRWKFLKEGFKSANGDCKWKIGELKKHKGELDMCHSGFHCSKNVYQAFSYVQGEILAEVEVGGKKEIGNDKEVYSEMKITRAFKWQKKDSVALSIYAAELCLKNFEKTYPNDKRPREAIEAAKRWLENPTKKNESAARSAESAAWSAAWSAESAAESVAWSAARSVAWSAAWSAARSAAESVAWSAESAVIKKISKWMNERVSVLEEINKQS